MLQRINQPLQIFRDANPGNTMDGARNVFMPDMTGSDST
jgi:hypothetical protein